MGTSLFEVYLGKEEESYLCKFVEKSLPLENKKQLGTLNMRFERISILTYFETWFKQFLKRFSLKYFDENRG